MYEQLGIFFFFLIENKCSKIASLCYEESGEWIDPRWKGSSDFLSLGAGQDNCSAETAGDCGPVMDMPRKDRLENTKMPRWPITSDKSIGEPVIWMNSEHESHGALKAASGEYLRLNSAVTTAKCSRVQCVYSASA